MTQEQELIERGILVIDVVRALREPEYRAELCRELEGGVTDMVMEEAADMIEALIQQLNEAKNQLDSETFTRERREARCRELHAQLEKAREVKPLVWSEWGEERASKVYRGDGLGVVYKVVLHPDGSGNVHRLGHRKKQICPYATTSAGLEWFQAQAQSDYQRRYNAMSQEGE